MASRGGNAWDWSTYTPLMSARITMDKSSLTYSVIRSEVVDLFRVDV